MRPVVVDTNVLLTAIPRKSAYNWLFDAFLKGKFTLAFSNEILTEYEEKFFLHWHPTMATDVSTVLLEAPNTIFVEVYYHFNLIKEDSDDNKFATVPLHEGPHTLLHLTNTSMF